MTTKLLRTLMGMVALVAMLTACSSEDVLLDEPNAKNEITFNVTTNRASRAHQIYANSNLPTFFNFSAWVRKKTDDVTASHVGKEYVQHDDVFYNSTSKLWENQSGLRYWPNGGDTEVLDFYAYVHGVKIPFNNQNEYYTNGNAFEFGKTESAPESVDPRLKTVNIEGEVTKQVDILYDTQFEKQSTDKSVNANTQVEFKFKHALTQVVFAAQKLSDKIHVEIEDITLVGTSSSGTFHFPRNENEFAYWSGNSESTLESHVSVQTIKEGETTESPIVVDSKPTGLTCEINEKEDGSGYSYTSINDLAMLLIPNNYKLGKYSTDDKKWTGAYLKVKCIIWNVSRPALGKQPSDVVLWGVKDGSTYKAEAEWLYIPIELSWDGQKDDNGKYTSCGGMNHRYIFTLKFGKGNAGQTATGERVIDAVSYSVGVEPWTEEQNVDVSEPGADREG